MSTSRFGRSASTSTTSPGGSALALTVELLARTVEQTEADVDAAVGAAREAFLTWRDVPAPVRGNLVKRRGRLLTEHKTEVGTRRSLDECPRSRRG
ncbi:aldehyde dehydrogenase family protein [Glycomyces sp. L485]|nr:aldehyde dehydrogenase family protein [Glycomyces sp. L485]MCH7232733.1 aldehyde dehydrogenase family protein [Glycomyces sp. L485]